MFGLSGLGIVELVFFFFILFVGLDGVCFFNIRC